MRTGLTLGFLATLTLAPLADAQSRFDRTDVAQRYAAMQQKRQMQRAARATRLAKLRADRATRMARLKKERAERRARSQELRQARGYRRLVVDGAQVEANIAKLTSKLHWHASLQAAQRVARAQNKPILWIHALGELEGLT